MENIIGTNVWQDIKRILCMVTQQQKWKNKCSIFDAQNKRRVSYLLSLQCLRLHFFKGTIIYFPEMEWIIIAQWDNAALITLNAHVWYSSVFSLKVINTTTALYTLLLGQANAFTRSHLHSKLKLWYHLNNNNNTDKINNNSNPCSSVC